MPSVSIKNFSGSIAKDAREASTSKCGFTSNFDVLTYPFALKPFPGMVANENTSFVITDFFYGVFGTGIGTNVLGYGRQTGADRPEIYMKTGDVVTSGWTTALSTTGAATQTRSSGSNLWHLYKNYGYFACGNRYIGRVGDLSSGTSATLVDNYYDLTSFTTVTQAITHPTDDRMYFGVDNKVYVNNAGTISLALTLPSFLTITSVEAQGNYLSIACKPSSNIGNSIVFLWDRDTSLATVSESIDWGNGMLNVIGTVDGILIGVSLLGATSFNLVPRIVVKAYADGYPVVVGEIVSESSAIDLRMRKWKSNNTLYFAAKLTKNGVVRNQLFAVGKDPNGRIVVVGDVLVDNDTALSGNINGFAKFEDVWFIAHNDNGSVNRTISDGSYSGTSTYDTLKNHGMPLEDRHSLKKLEAVGMRYDPLASTATAGIEYRVDGSTWTEAFTDTADNGTVLEATAAADGTPFLEGLDYEFRAKSTGGARINEIFYRYSTVTSQTDG
ncbi:hypothetical protein [Dongia sp.]|uniref:hypothetical protein n=1 Tax=Dongia sp. TaxID=1977262 RepID=UPI003750F9CC